MIATFTSSRDAAIAAHQARTIAERIALACSMVVRSPKPPPRP
jgi:hypothetical protein